MLTFFRRIRKGLLGSGHARKYLLYAIGEIALVVIGILIALQINNWNENQKLENEEMKLLTEMRHNLESDLRDCVWNIKKQQQLFNSNSAVLQHLELRMSMHDTMKYHYANLVYSTTQRRNMSAYEYLKSRGSNLISNDNIRRRITTLYSERYYIIEKMEIEYDNTFQLNQVIPQLNTKLVIDKFSNAAYPIDLQSLWDDNAFKGAIRMNAHVRTSMEKRYKNIQSVIEDLIAQIDVEIKNRE